MMLSPRAQRAAKRQASSLALPPQPNKQRKTQKASSTASRLSKRKAVIRKKISPVASLFPVLPYLFLEFLTCHEKVQFSLSEKQTQRKVMSYLLQTHTFVAQRNIEQWDKYHSIKKLYVHVMHQQPRLSSLPTSLTVLKIVQKINVADCSFPSSLQILSSSQGQMPIEDVMHLSRLQKLEVFSFSSSHDNCSLPSSLTQLQINCGVSEDKKCEIRKHGCRLSWLEIKHILPSGLLVLTMPSTSLSSLENLPDSLLHLKLHTLTTSPQKWPSCLISLDLHHCEVDLHVPPSLLRLQECNLTNLKGATQFLRHLSVRANVTQLGNFGPYILTRYTNMLTLTIVVDRDIFFSFSSLPNLNTLIQLQKLIINNESEILIKIDAEILPKQLRFLVLKGKVAFSLSVKKQFSNLRVSHFPCSA